MNNTEVSKVEVVGDVSIKGDNKKEATGKLILDLAKIFLVGAVANRSIARGKHNRTCNLRFNVFITLADWHTFNI